MGPDQLLTNAILKAIKTKELYFTKALRYYVNFTNAIRTNAPLESIERLYDQLLEQLEEIEYVANKTLLVSEASLTDIECRNLNIENAAKEIADLEQGLTDLKMDLSSALEEKQRMDEYLVKIKKIQKLPSRTVLKKQIEKLEGQLTELRNETEMLMKRGEKQINYISILKKCCEFFTNEMNKSPEETTTLSINK